MTPDFFAVYPAMTCKRNAGGRQPLDAVAGRAIVLEVAAKHKVHSSHIMGPFRDRESCAARQDVIRRLWAMSWNLSAIGRFLDRDHSTINHALGRLRKVSGRRIVHPQPVPILDR